MLKLKEQYINSIIKVPYYDKPILGKLINPNLYNVIYSKAPYLFYYVCPICQKQECVCDDFIDFDGMEGPIEKKKKRK